MMLFTYILIIIILLIVSFSKRITFVSDHYYHLKFINAIKKQNHHFLSSSPIIHNEKNLCYPQIYHLILSFFKKPDSIFNIKLQYFILNLAGLILLNSFYYVMESEKVYHYENILFLNLIYLFIPFNYSVWNAKNSGLSPRLLGLIFGQLFLFFLLIILETGSMLTYFFLTSSFILIVLSSQMAFQYGLMMLLIVSLLTQRWLLLMIPLFSFFLLFLVIPKIIKSFLLGQYFHKKNYASYLAEIFIFKERYSIYRDFVYDFWVKLIRNPKDTVFYIYYNPINEVLFQMPVFALMLFYIILQLDYHNSTGILILSTGLVFILTSFRSTRFLGEPQRYIEFSLPLCCSLFIMKTDLEERIIILIFSILISLFNYILKSFNIKFKQKSNEYKNDIINFINNAKNLKGYITSNDNDFLKFITHENLKSIKPDLTCHYSNKNTFEEQFIGDYRQISKQTLMKYYVLYHFDYILISKDLEKNDNLKSLIDICDMTLLYENLYYQFYGKKKI